ncbi:MAG: DNA polymerase IV [Candidatus Parcubacteria bacterium]|nr:DNA polymerase IV [Candidatus Parcubacteria bacterium]
MKDRIILLIDMDYFFAQIEERENPRFKGNPVVVGSDPKEGKGRGVVSTANYMAREYGIHSALPISIAWRKCPTAIFLPVNMELYEKTSIRIMNIIKKYSPVWEIVSLDEAYIDISFVKSFRKAKVLAEKLKGEILKKEKLTSTIGIGTNKVIAKMAASKAKPNGLLIIVPTEVRKFLNPLNVEKLPGIGPKTAQKLLIKGIKTIGDIRKLRKGELKDAFGKVGEYIYERARGIDDSPVFNDETIKSIGKEYTFEEDTRDSSLIFRIFSELCSNACQEMKKEGYLAKTITVVCRYADFETHTKAKSLKEASSNAELLEKVAKKLLLKFLIEKPKLIRLVGVRISVI